jgi:hypothetical protein
MEGESFNPFEDRLSRDIRNDLSEGFAAAVEEANPAKLSAILENYRSQALAPAYTEYIDRRSVLYASALLAISQLEPNPLTRATVLWDKKHFFEMHEILEHAWYSAEGAYQEMLQALIRAAGVYIKKEYGFFDAAARISAKALPVLRKNRDYLGKFMNIENLIESLAENFETPSAISLLR